jgi:hypothetical protein
MITNHIYSEGQDIVDVYVQELERQNILTLEETTLWIKPHTNIACANIYSVGVVFRLETAILPGKTIRKEMLVESNGKVSFEVCVGWWIDTKHYKTFGAALQTILSGIDILI